MAQVTYTKENDKYYADFDNRKKTLWKERWINPIDMPEPTPSVTKGEIINIDMNGDGTTEQYRVLKVNNNVVEVLAMSDATNIAFDNNSGNIYTGKTLDNYLNSSWYNTLSEIAKEAIVDKTFKQDSWYRNTSGDPIYQCKYNTGTYQLSLGNTSYGSEITRHVYVIGIQDVIDYLEATPSMTEADTTLTHTNIWQMFWNSTFTHNGYLWLCSASATNNIHAFRVNSDVGSLDTYGVYNMLTVRPAFQIDLTKIEWTPVVE